MKTVIAAAIIAVAGSAAFAGPYVGAEYMTGDVTASVAGIGATVDVSGTRVYAGAEGKVTDKVTANAEIGHTSGKVSVAGLSAKADIIDWKIGGEYEVTDMTSIYVTYEANSLNENGIDLDAGMTTVGIRFNF